MSTEERETEKTGGNNRGRTKLKNGDKIMIQTNKKHDYT